MVGTHLHIPNILFPNLLQNMPFKQVNVSFCISIAGLVWLWSQFEMSFSCNLLAAAPMQLRREIKVATSFICMCVVVVQRTVIHTDLFLELDRVNRALS